MKDTGIMFKGEMVRAILAGRKTQTRRVVKLPPVPHTLEPWCLHGATSIDGPAARFRASNPNRGCFGATEDVRCPYGVVGDRLWVRETWQGTIDNPTKRVTLHGFGVIYRADLGDKAPPPDGGRWSPSLLMPRWASRIALEITEVRVERLHDITEDDARMEGATPMASRHHLEYESHPHREAFISLWVRINGAASWATNPWLWVIGFKRCA